MSFLLRLCLGLVLLAPSLAQAQLTALLETPGDGDNLSGIGVIRGWKCEAGDITVRFDDDEALTYPMVYGSERPDTEETPDGKIICGDKDNGFVAIYNWALLDDGEHTAQAYDNDVPFGKKHSFTVASTGEEYLEDASACVTVENFPSDGETTMLEWNQSTQHFEMVEACPPDEPAPPAEPVDLGMCRVGLPVPLGAMCSGSIFGNRFTFSVNADGQGCIESALGDKCYDTELNLLGASAMKNDDGDWIITALP